MQCVCLAFVVNMDDFNEKALQSSNSRLQNLMHAVFL